MLPEVYRIFYCSLHQLIEFKCAVDNMTILRGFRVAPVAHIQNLKYSKSTVPSKLSDPNGNPRAGSTILKASKRNQDKTTVVALAKESADNGAPFDYLPCRLRQPSYNEHLYNPSIPDFPSRILTLLRFVQLIFMNISMHILPRCELVVAFVKVEDAWCVPFVVSLHLCFWLVEENVIRTVKVDGKARAVLYCFTVIVSGVYTICSSFIATFLYVSFNFSVYVILGVAFLSVLYFGYHLHWTAKAAWARTMLNYQAWNEGDAVLSFIHTTRPETDETRLNIAPRLVYPIMEEYSIPDNIH